MEVPLPRHQRLVAGGMMVSVVTPWLDHPELVEGYAEAVAGADEVIVVLNRGDAGMFRGHDFVIHQPGAPLGFAASNNRGASFVTGDILVYLNNDVTGGFIDAVRRDVEDGALYGPSIVDATRVIRPDGSYAGLNFGGQPVPYVEGWCVAATRETWGEVGPWDAEAFPRPYWEDVDLSLRAIRAGIAIKRAPWPVQHLGGTTTQDPALNAWEGFWDQRAVVQRRLDAVLA